MRDYQRESQLLRERLACLKEDQAVLKTLLEQEMACQGELEHCRAEKAREQQDVDRLQGLSLAAFLAVLRGNKDEELAREQAEAYAAAARYETAKRQLEDVWEDVVFRRSRIRKNSSAPEEYERLLREKAEALGGGDSPAARTLRQLEEQLSGLTARCRELQEAISAGEAVEANLRSLARKMDDAEGWSTFDLVGGGLLADMAKYSALEDAQHLARQLQGGLRRYEAELADVTIPANFQIEIDHFLGIADVWFDNIFTDWAVRDHIQASKRRIGEARRQVDQVQGQLRADLSAAKAELDRVHARWQQAAEQL